MFLLSAAPLPDDQYDRGACRGLRRSAAADRFGVHTLTNAPAAADLILLPRSMAPVPILRKCGAIRC